MKALKAAVIGMGVLIFLGLGIVVAAIISRVSDDENKSVEKADVMVALPQGCEVIRATGIDGQLALRLSRTATSECPAFVLVNPETGTIERRIYLEQASGPQDEAAAGEQSE